MPAKKQKVIIVTVPRKNRFLPVVATLLVFTLAAVAFFTWSYAQKRQQVQSQDDGVVEVQVVEPIDLPRPATSGRMSLETALNNRRTRRDFTDSGLTLRQVSQMLWSVQGVTVDWGGRTAPTFKSVYPLSIYLAAFRVDGLDQGIYKYLPGERGALHQIAQVRSGDFQADLAKAIAQNSVSLVPAIIFITGDFEKMAKAYEGIRMDNNVYLEAGHAAQNAFLQAESLGLGMVPIANLNQSVSDILELASNETLIYALPFGAYQR